jgi:hypothetical protein
MYIMQALNLHIAKDRLSDYRRDIPQTLRSLMNEPGLKHAAFVAEQDGSALTMVLLVWETRETADQWTRGAGYRTLLDGMRPYLSGEVVITFFGLEGVGFNYPDYEFDPDRDEVESVPLPKNCGIETNRR